MPHACTALVLPRLTDHTHCMLRNLCVFLVCVALSTPQLVSEQITIVLEVSFLSNLLGLAYLLVKRVLHIFSEYYCAVIIAYGSDTK